MITRTSTEIISDWKDNSTTNAKLTHFDATENVETVFWISIIVLGTLAILFWLWTILNVIKDCCEIDNGLYRVKKSFIITTLRRTYNMYVHFYRFKGSI